MMMQEVLRDTLVEIDLKKLANNMRLIRQLVGPDTAITAVVKANAYGHGAVGIAETLIESGADYLAVATLSEAVEIKKAYPAYPVFIMGHTPDKYLSHIVDFDITATIFSLRQAELLNELAEKAGKKVKVHQTGHRVSSPRPGREGPRADPADDPRNHCAAARRSGGTFFTSGAGQ